MAHRSHAPVLLDLLAAGPAGRRPLGALAIAAILAGCGGGSGTPAPAASEPAAAERAPFVADAAPEPALASELTADTGKSACRKAPDEPRRTVPALGQGEPAGDAHVAGMWSPVIDWPLIPVHVILTPDGRVMSYGTTREGRQTARFNYAVWDPALGTGTDSIMSLPNTTTTDIFCNAQITMPQDGRVLLAGGDNYVAGMAQNTGNDDSVIYDPQTRLLSPSTKLQRPRWYGTPALLGNGDILLIGGRGNLESAALPSHPEVRRPDGTTRLLSNVDTSTFNIWYPRAFPTRDGRMFGYELNGGAYYIDPAGQGRLSPVGHIDYAPVGDTSSVAMYAPGKMLVAGGRTAAAVTVDFGGPLPLVRRTAPMSAVRHYGTLSVLPTGDVLATGGSGVDNALVDVADHVEIWSPATEQWTRGASGAIARLYHSVAMLLPDGSMLVGGGGSPGPLTNTNAELYFPPYLFEEGGRWAERPTITAASTALDPGEVLTVDVESPRPIARLTLVKSGSVTHAMNFEQRFLDLPFRSDGKRLTATLPSNAFELPPGFWMVFAIDDRGVPSVARILRVMVPAEPVVETGWTPSIGGQIRLAGDRYAASCNVDEVMVGVRGALLPVGALTVIGRIQPVCVRTDASGRWSGAPVARSVAAGAGAGEAFERVCPANQAVSGLEARAGSTLDSLRLTCAPLGADRTVTGMATRLDTVGGTGGADHAPIVCAAGKAATGIYGLARAAVQSVGLVCGATVVDPRTVSTAAPTPVVPATTAPVTTAPATTAGTGGC
jgi:hypothetical protein